MDCRLTAGIAADTAAGRTTSDARLLFLRRTCPCAECKAWRAWAKGRVRVPAPFVPQGLFCILPSARTEQRRDAKALKWMAAETTRAVWTHPAVSVIA